MATKTAPAAPFPLITAPDPALSAPLYTTGDVAQVLRTTQKTVQMWIRASKLPAVRIGSQWRIRQSDLAAFVAGGSLDAVATPPTD